MYFKRDLGRRVDSGWALPHISSFFNSPWDLRAPLADRSETLSRDQYRYQRRYYNASPKIWGASLKNFEGEKHAKFGTILHNFQLWSRISVERNRISEIGKICDRERFFPRSEKQVQWTLVNYPWVVHVSLDPPKSTFSGDYISALGVQAPEIFTCAKDWPRLASTYHKPRRGSPQKF